jgi:hypothetical protein
MSVRIRIDGPPAEVAEAVRRQQMVLDVPGKSSKKPSRQGPGNVVVYLEGEVIDHG